MLAQAAFQGHVPFGSLCAHMMLDAAKNELHVLEVRIFPCLAFLKGLTFEEYARLTGTQLRQVEFELDKQDVWMLKKLKGFEDFDKGWGEGEGAPAAPLGPYEGPLYGF